MRIYRKERRISPPSFPVQTSGLNSASPGVNFHEEEKGREEEKGVVGGSLKLKNLRRAGPLWVRTAHQTDSARLANPLRFLCFFLPMTSPQCENRFNKVLSLSFSFLLDGRRRRWLLQSITTSTTMASNAHLGFGGGALAHISLAVPRPRTPCFLLV